MKVMRNSEYDYSLSYEDTKTLDTYSQLKEKIYHAPTKEYGIFFAFSDEQFKEGMKECGYTSTQGILKGPGGGFGTKEGWDKLAAFYESVDKEISEKCDPFEVFCWEYNNYENCLSYGIKEEVKEIIKDLWDDDTLKECIRKFKKIPTDEFIEV